MKKQLFTIISILLVIQLSAKPKIGLIFLIENEFYHTHIGLTVFENFQVEYDLNIEEICKEKTLKVFDSQYSTIEYKIIDKADFLEYLYAENNLSRKELKKYRIDWMQKIKEKFGLAGVIVISNEEPKTKAYPNITYGKAGVSTGFIKSNYKNTRCAFRK